ncbi:hypothetical protein BDZ45DRAFT_772788, partial [Acephala macrosclerotiorum]
FFPQTHQFSHTLTHDLSYFKLDNYRLLIHHTPSEVILLLEQSVLVKMSSGFVFKAYVGPSHPQNQPDFWCDKPATKTIGQTVVKNQQLDTASRANEQKFQAKQQNQLADLKAKQAHHAKIQQKLAKKLQRMKEAMKITEAGGIPKGFEEYPLYGGGDDEVKQAIKQKLFKDLLELKPTADKINAIAAQIEKDIKLATSKVTIR